MSEKFNTPIIDAVGGIHIGNNFMQSFAASWPFGRIEIYEDKLTLKVQYVPDFLLKIYELAGKFPFMMGAYKEIPKEIYLKYNEIKGYKEKNLSILGYGITFVHNNSQYAPFLQVWVWKKNAQKIIEYLNKKGISKIE